MKRLTSNKAFTIIGLLMVVVIIGLLIYFCLKERPVIPTGSSDSMIKEAGIDTSSYKGTLDSTKDLIKGIETEAPDLQKIMDQY